MGGSDAGRLAVANTLGGSGGTETLVLIEANLPPHAHAMVHTHPIDHDRPNYFRPDAIHRFNLFQANVSAGPTNIWNTNSPGINIDLPNFVATSGAASTASTGNGAGTSTAINKMPSYSLVNWIIKL